MTDLIKVNDIVSWMQSVDWYQAGTSSYPENEFSYDAPTSTSNTFGTSFNDEDEEPLLQGILNLALHCLNVRSRLAKFSGLKSCQAPQLG